MEKKKAKAVKRPAKYEEKIIIKGTFVEIIDDIMKDARKKSAPKKSVK